MLWYVWAQFAGRWVTPGEWQTPDSAAYYLRTVGGSRDAYAFGGRWSKSWWGKETWQSGPTLHATAPNVAAALTSYGQA